MKTNEATLLTIPEAIEVFVRGFTFKRSITHPYVGDRFGSVWVMRDAPRRRDDFRTEEWVACETLPEEVDALARREARGRYAICAICPEGESPEGIRRGYKALGYRLARTEPFMVHSLKKIRPAQSPAMIEPVKTPELAERLAVATGSRPLRPEFLLPDSPLRQYVAVIGKEIVGWVRSIRAGDATWCDTMYVAPTHRRQGIGSSLLAQMLRGDRKQGSRASVLLASHTGAKLYSSAGYDRIGTLFLFNPGRPGAKKS